MDKRFLSILAAIALVFIGFLIFNKKETAAPGSTASSAVVTPSHHTFGEGKKHVTLIEYGDLQCPACGQYYPLVKQLKDDYKTDITFQYRNFPLESLHPNARAAHRAVEAAAAQGKFWEMHNKLYETQQQWSTLSDVKSVFETYAQELGLDTAKFSKDYASQRVNSIINEDIAEGKKAGADSTPTFVLDGQKIDNPRSLDDFKKVIDDEIALKNPASTTPAADTSKQNP